MLTAVPVVVARPVCDSMDDADIAAAATAAPASATTVVDVDVACPAASTAGLPPLGVGGVGEVWRAAASAKEAEGAGGGAVWLPVEAGGITILRQRMAPNTKPTSESRAFARCRLCRGLNHANIENAQGRPAAKHLIQLAPWTRRRRRHHRDPPNAGGVIPIAARQFEYIFAFFSFLIIWQAKWTNEWR